MIISILSRHHELVKFNREQSELDTATHLYFLAPINFSTLTPEINMLNSYDEVLEKTYNGGNNYLIILKFAHLQRNKQFKIVMVGLF